MGTPSASESVTPENINDLNRKMTQCLLPLRPSLQDSPTSPLSEQASPTTSLRSRSPITETFKADECFKRDKNFAYVTLLTRDTYLMGVQALKRSLDAVASRFNLVVLHTNSLSEYAIATLLSEGCILRKVDRYTPSPSSGIDHAAYKVPCYAECWCKLRMWEMEEEYSRLVYLDADMIVLRNIDHLFDLPLGFYAAPDCAAGRPTQQERDACALHTAAGARPTYFNAGMFLMSPSIAQLCEFEEALTKGHAEVGGYAEQDFLNWYFKDTWEPLHHTFNLQKGIRHHHPSLWTPDTASIIHYTDKKPWEGIDGENEVHADIVNVWWEVYLKGEMMGRR